MSKAESQSPVNWAGGKGEPGFPGLKTRAGMRSVRSQAALEVIDLIAPKRESSNERGWRGIYFGPWRAAGAAPAPKEPRIRVELRPSAEYNGW
jgi:hypothetical protein